MVVYIKMSHNISSNTSNKETVKQYDIYGVYLYYFDETKGHELLICYPETLRDSKQDEKVIEIHSIWWLKDSFDDVNAPEHIDLEIYGQIYSATLFYSKSMRKKRRPGMTSDKWEKEHYVLIVKAPATLSFMAQEFVVLLRDQIKSEIGNDLSYLILNQIDIINSMNFSDDHRNTITVKSEMVNNHLVEIFKKILPRSPLSKLGSNVVEAVAKQMNLEVESKVDTSFEDMTNPIEEEEVHYIVKDSSNNEIQLWNVDQTQEKKVIVKDVNFLEDIKVIRLLIINKSPLSLENVNIRVIESQDLFERGSWATQIDFWKVNEELLVEFKAESEGHISYFLRIEDDDGIILVKRLRF